MPSSFEFGEGWPGSPCFEVDTECYSVWQLCKFPEGFNSTTAKQANITGVCSCFPMTGKINPEWDGCHTLTRSSWIIMAWVLGFCAIDLWGLFLAQNIFRGLPKKQRFKVIGLCLVATCVACAMQFLYHVCDFFSVTEWVDRRAIFAISKVTTCFGASSVILALFQMPLMWIELVRAAEEMTKTPKGGLGKTKKFLLSYSAFYVLVSYSANILANLPGGDSIFWNGISSLAGLISALVVAALFWKAGNKISKLLMGMSSQQEGGDQQLIYQANIIQAAGKKISCICWAHIISCFVFGGLTSGFKGKNGVLYIIIWNGGVQGSVAVGMVVLGKFIEQMRCGGGQKERRQSNIKGKAGAVAPAGSTKVSDVSAFSVASEVESSDLERTGDTMGKSE